ncbi:hypothetical protein C8R43DRAFT_949997 [Mycena crocata]|nr:hypothetical protein C8R43DRAFT_949997 [Mycena crocata]
MTTVHISPASAVQDRYRLVGSSVEVSGNPEAALIWLRGYAGSSVGSVRVARIETEIVGVRLFDARSYRDSGETWARPKTSPKIFQSNFNPISTSAELRLRLRDVYFCSSHLIKICLLSLTSVIFFLRHFSVQFWFNFLVNFSHPGKPPPSTSSSLASANMPHEFRLNHIYEDCLIHLGHRFPLWEADPGLDKEIQMGDMGLDFYEEGQFKRVERLPLRLICGDNYLEPPKLKPFPKRKQLSKQVRKSREGNAGLSFNHLLKVGGKCSTYRRPTYFTIVNAARTMYAKLLKVGKRGRLLVISAAEKIRTVPPKRFAHKPMSGVFCDTGVEQDAIEPTGILQMSPRAGGYTAFRMPLVMPGAGTHLKASVLFLQKVWRYLSRKVVSRVLSTIAVHRSISTSSSSEVGKPSEIEVLSVQSTTLTWAKRASGAEESLGAMKRDSTSATAARTESIGSTPGACDPTATLSLVRLGSSAPMRIVSNVLADNRMPSQ